MKIALVSDIHANLHALEAVLAHARQEVCDAYWNLGDLVGYGPFPDETIDCIRGIANLSILGNYDRKVLAFPKRREKWKDRKRPLKFLAFQWAYEHLSKDSRKYLERLPAGMLAETEAGRFFLTHGSPFSDEETIYPGTPRRRLRYLGEKADADVLLCGHTHVPFAFQFDHWWFLNPGSVGRPGGGETRACYAILQIASGSWEISHYRLAYDIALAAAAIRERGLPEEFARMVETGKSLEELEAGEQRVNDLASRRTIDP